ncbi:hypothetical protein [Cytobacillus firmus]|uniref:Uncharacterized protein n=1 Tax=Cytobacillus firmus TaxID=1399 RepID=A0AA46PH78_CYTFI|nr:hypothetical protein [Cytobacillus firmus]UYG98238.1 hypothetical protein OD459_25545 [Cytobacillus firmus]
MGSIVHCIRLFLLVILYLIAAGPKKLVESAVAFRKMQYEFQNALKEDSTSFDNQVNQDSNQDEIVPNSSKNYHPHNLR